MSICSMGDDMNHMALDMLYIQYSAASFLAIKVIIFSYLLYERQMPCGLEKQWCFNNENISVA